MSPYPRMRDPLENRELRFSGRLPLEDRPEEVVLVIWIAGAPRLVPSEWAIHRRPGGGFSEPLGPEDVMAPGDP